MALDRALLDRLAERPAGDAAPILRFYAWDAPTLSFGRMQRAADDLLRRCGELGIPAVRRPTGGKAILHHREVTFSIITPVAGLGGVLESYRIFAHAIASGLRCLGVEAALCQPKQAGRRSAALCFAAPAACDLEVGGRKLLGSAQARRGGALLQQNSLPLVLSHELKEALFGAAAAEEEARIATDLHSLMGREPSSHEVRDALIAGLESELRVTFEPSVLAVEESGAAETSRPAFAI
jgi:lipoate-protein ligase A